MGFGSEPHGTSTFSANLAGAASFRWVEAARCPSGSTETSSYLITRLAQVRDEGCGVGRRRLVLRAVVIAWEVVSELINKRPADPAHLRVASRAAVFRDAPLRDRISAEEEIWSRP